MRHHSVDEKRRFVSSGSLGSFRVTLASGFNGFNNTIRTSVNNLSRTYRPEVMLNNQQSTFAQQPGIAPFSSEPTQTGITTYYFPLGSCTPLVTLPLNSASFSILPITGEWQATDGNRVSYGAYRPITNLNPTFNLGSDSITFSVGSDKVLCGTPSGAGVAFVGNLSVSGLTQPVVNEYAPIFTDAITPKPLNTPIPTVGTSCTVGGSVTVTIDGTARKLAYCN